MRDLVVRLDTLRLRGHVMSDVSARSLPRNGQFLHGLLGQRFDAPLEPREPRTVLREGFLLICCRQAIPCRLCLRLVLEPLPSDFLWLQEVDASPLDLARRAEYEPHDGARRDAFAASGFAHHAEGLALSYD